MGIQKICAKLVPKKLANEQKGNPRNMRMDLLQRIENDENFFQTCHNRWWIWILEYSPETKRQDSECHTSYWPRPKKEGMSKSKIKQMRICFFYSQRVVRKDFVPQGQAVHSTVVRSLNDSEKGFIVSSQRLRTLGCCSTTTLPVHCHLREWIVDQKWYSSSSAVPYSPELSPCDFFLFPQLKFHLKGRTVDSVQKVVTDQLRALQHEDFQHCYRKWE